MYKAERSSSSGKAVLCGELCDCPDMLAEPHSELHLLGREGRERTVVGLTRYGRHPKDSPHRDTNHQHNSGKSNYHRQPYRGMPQKAHSGNLEKHPLSSEFVLPWSQLYSVFQLHDPRRTYRHSRAHCHACGCRHGCRMGRSSPRWERCANAACKCARGRWRSPGLQARGLFYSAQPQQKRKGASSRRGGADQIQFRIRHHHRKFALVPLP